MINLTINFTYQNTSTGDEVIFRRTKQNITVSGADSIVRTQQVGTSEEALVLSTDITTAGYVFIENMDPTNFVEIAPASTETKMIKLLPGEFTVFRMAGGAVPTAQADTATVQVRYGIIEE